MEDILQKIQEDLRLDVEVTLIRLLPNGKQMHSVVRRPDFSTDVDFYMIILDASENDEENSDGDNVTKPIVNPTVPFEQPSCMNQSVFTSEE
ncbi:hypothetical protein IV203_032597 [Nitzschia inconspicua]|uniref:Uncharacterized protein n=1 Tax=Nitzschia inconspicua TaxID=303405 RepID=A0A9K3KKL2_9STRA|nr:hypothetical protein IV203_032597 [Nitzschia inconspicua]